MVGSPHAILCARAFCFFFGVANMTTETAHNRGPITSVFTPPPSCLYSTVGTSPFFRIGHALGGGEGCYPSTAPLEFGRNSDSMWYHYYYSPAICPSGWNTAKSLTSIGSGPSMVPGTSGYQCCPLQYTAGSGDHYCHLSLSSGQPLTYRLDTSSPVLTTTLTDGEAYVACDGIPILWATTDLVILELLGSTTPSSSIISTSTSSSSAGTRSSSAGTRSASPGSPLSPSNSGPTSSASSGSQSGNNASHPANGLSPGQAAGVAISVLVFVALLGLGLVLHQRKRRKVRNLPTREAAEASMGAQGPPELQTISNTHELGGEAKTDVETLGVYGKERTNTVIQESPREAKTEVETHALPEKDTTDTEHLVPLIPPKLPIPPPKEFDHPTTSTAHELSRESLPRGHELESHFSALPRRQELDSHFSVLHEMDTRSQSSEILPEWITRAELDVQRATEVSGSPQASPAETILSPSSSSARQYSISRKPVSGQGDGEGQVSPKPMGTGIEEDNETDEQEEARMKLLMDRIERVRADKERLLEIQRLSQIEEETKAEILAVAQKRGKGKRGDGKDLTTNNRGVDLESKS